MKVAHKKDYTCGDCGKAFARKYTLHRHRKRAHNPAIHRDFRCISCQGDAGRFDTMQELMEHRRRIHQQGQYNFIVENYTRESVMSVMSLNFLHCHVVVTQENSQRDGGTVSKKQKQTGKSKDGMLN